MPIHLLLMAAALALPLHPGTYVREGSTCADAPFAAMFTYDGHDLAGPHEQGCTSTLSAHRGGAYTVSTRCTELGDHTPTTPTTDIVKLKILSPTRLVRTHSGDVATYRLCKAASIKP